MTSELATPRRDGLPAQVGIVGGTSQVGRVVIDQLLRSGVTVTAFSRQQGLSARLGLRWLLPEQRAEAAGISHWLSLAPAYALPDYLSVWQRIGAKRMVMLSSTTLLTKQASPRPADRALAQSLQEAEDALKRWSAETGADYTVLRPTLVYGYGRDKNVAEIARFIRRFGFFPLLGRADGLRQPVHVEDVAAAAITALVSPNASGQTYTISGGEALPYREMVERIFSALNRKPLLLTIPSVAFRSAIPVMRIVPRYRGWTAEMAERMNNDQSFSHAEAARDLGVTFRPFRPTAEDVR